MPVYRLYKAALDRTPDQSGLGYWIKQLDAGKGDIVWMSANFIDSAEFKATYGTPQNGEQHGFRQSGLQERAGTIADAAGFSFWRASWRVAINAKS